MIPNREEAKARDSKTAICNARHLVRQDFEAVDRLIRQALHSKVERINEIVEHLINSGGKRLRPLILLVVANNLGYQGDGEHHELAAIIEFIHTSTLLHDDVVDESSRRRNQATANTVWGNAASVLAGDFLYSRAFQLLAKRSNIPVMKILADTSNQLAEGEVMQLVNCSNSQLSEADYFEVIRRKTAQLYSAACEIAALIAQPNHKHYHQLSAAYGMHLGMAFQMVDDMLDYAADSASSGKNLGDDLAEGKMTLPLIHALENGSKAEQAIIRRAIETEGREAIAEVTAAIQRNKGDAYTLMRAREQIQQAQTLLEQFPNNVHRDALTEIGQFVLLRHY